MIERLHFAEQNSNRFMIEAITKQNSKHTKLVTES